MPEIVAKVSIIGEVSHTQDRILSNAISGRMPVILSGWNHSALKSGTPPAGKGVVFEEKGNIIFEGNYFKNPEAEKLQTQIKELNDNGAPEWSLTYLEQEFSITEENGNYIYNHSQIEPIEVSPVYRGNLDGTETISLNTMEGYKQTFHVNEITTHQKEPVETSSQTVETPPQPEEAPPTETPPEPETTPEEPTEEQLPLITEAELIRIKSQHLYDSDDE